MSDDAAGILAAFAGINLVDLGSNSASLQVPAEKI
jgi:hypothetical protein